MLQASLGGVTLPILAQVADVIVQQHSSEVHWLDHGTEHPHRIALSVHTNRLQDCISHLQRGFEQHSVQVDLQSRWHLCAVVHSCLYVEFV